ncbi:MAG: glycosyltransferase family 4 protein [Acidobacteria bacterium]|nr:glycosyltransferase family 4 protein [Acidobacteriota bacterium]
MKKIRINYIERKFYQFVSIEKAFRQIGKGLCGERFEVSFEQVPYLSSLSGTIKNLLFFRLKNKADIYHITGHVHYIALLFPPRQTVLSIMDVRFMYTYRGLRRFVLKKLLLDLPVKRLEYLTAISEETKREIVRFTDCDPRKIRVLDLPLLDHIHPVDETVFNSERPRLLQVGTTDNKNLPNVVRALRGIECKLVIVGRLDEMQLTVLRENAIDFENLFDLDDDELRNEYARADIVIFCSTYEGFGLPIIEAQSMRKPVLASDASPMRETAGGAAELVDPHDIESIRKGILKLIADPERRLELVEAGLQNIRRFEPKAVAAGYAELYEEMIKA